MFRKSDMAIVKKNAKSPVSQVNKIYATFSSCFLISVLALEIQLLKDRDHINGFIPPHICACSQSGTGFPYVVVLFLCLMI